MNVPSYEFIAFATVVAVLINLSSASRWRRAILLLANGAFFLTFTRDVLQLLPFGGLLLVGFAGVKLVERRKGKGVFTALIATMVFAFCWLKHYTFVPHQLFLPFAYMTIGLSYVFFRVMHLIIDAYQNTLSGRIGPVSYFNYTLNFTSLVSGPIQLYKDYRRSESEQPAPLTEGAVGRALERIITGLFKVSVISPLLLYMQARCVTAIAPGLSLAHGVIYAALIMAIFPVYLYFNFSGYMDFVIGVARFLRLELPENFDRPFLSKGYIEFWGRWHMTLSNWLKTYVFSPLLLGLMRLFPSRSSEPLLGVFAYFVTFFLIGVWHGQTATFLFFGVLQGLGVSVNKLYQIAMTRALGRVRYGALCANVAYSSVSRGLTFGWFAFSTLWFWSTWAQLAHFAAILGLSAILIAPVVFIAAATSSLNVLALVQERARDLTLGTARVFASRYVRAAWCTVLFVITISWDVLLNAPAPHIVYKAF